MDAKTRELLELAATELEQQHAMLVERDHEYEEAREHRLAREIRTHLATPPFLVGDRVEFVVADAWMPGTIVESAADVLRAEADLPLGGTWLLRPERTRLANRASPATPTDPPRVDVEALIIVAREAAQRQHEERQRTGIQTDDDVDRAIVTAVARAVLAHVAELRRRHREAVANANRLEQTGGDDVSIEAMAAYANACADENRALRDVLAAIDALGGGGR